MNDAMGHRGTFQDCWKTINSLIGEEVRINSAKDGAIVWTVVGSESVTQDDFKDIREEQEKYLVDLQNSVMKNFDEFESQDHTNVFWKMFSDDIDSDVRVLNEEIEKTNRTKENKTKQEQQETQNNNKQKEKQKGEGEEEEEEEERERET